MNEIYHVEDQGDILLKKEIQKISSDKYEFETYKSFYGKKFVIIYHKETLEEFYRIDLSHISVEDLLKRLKNIE